MYEVKEGGRSLRPEEPDGLVVPIVPVSGIVPRSIGSCFVAQFRLLLLKRFNVKDVGQFLSEYLLKKQIQL